MPRATSHCGPIRLNAASPSYCADRGAGLACAPAAHADSSVIPDTPDLPWANPTHESPLESSRRGSPPRSRSARCGSIATVRQSGRRAGRRPPGDTSSRPAGTRAASPDGQLDPGAALTDSCELLWRFAKASSKPTKCQASRTVTTTRTVKVRYRTTVPVKVTRRVKVRGAWVTKRVTVKKVVWKTRTEERTESTTTEIDPVPCYRPSVGPDVVVGSPDPAYAGYVYAIQALVHETFHLVDFTAGKPAITTTPYSSHGPSASACRTSLERRSDSGPPRTMRARWRSTTPRGPTRDGSRPRPTTGRPSAGSAGRSTSIRRHRTGRRARTGRSPIRLCGGGEPGRTGYTASLAGVAQLVEHQLPAEGGVEPPPPAVESPAAPAFVGVLALAFTTPQRLARF